jgi:hypothetical protein
VYLLYLPTSVTIGPNVIKNLAFTLTYGGAIEKACNHKFLNSSCTSGEVGFAVMKIAVYFRVKVTPCIM